MQDPDHPRLCLASHVRSCSIEGQVILLDLRRGKYLGVPERHAATLAQFIARWPEPAASNQPPSDEIAATATRPLLAQGLLASSDFEPSATPVAAEVLASLRASDRVGPEFPGLGRAQRFIRSSARTALALRFRSLQSIAAAISSRRIRSDLRRPAVDEYVGPVASYEWLRPLVFTAREKCLFDSMALLHYLASERLDATLVLGVKTRPFAAHAWLQLDTVVLNDREEHVRRFTPILVV